MRVGRVREETRAGLESKRMLKSRIVEENDNGDNGIERMADAPGTGRKAVLTMPWTCRRMPCVRLHDLVI